MGTLNPTMGQLDLTPLAPRIWLGGPGRNCWRMRYNTGALRWELEGGNGLVLYTMSGTWLPNLPNVFDVLLMDLTLQAPSSITVYPLSPLPCTCPAVLEPPMGALNLTPYPPAIRQGLAPDTGMFALTPYAPEISETGGITTSCCANPIPALLNVAFSGFTGGCTPWNGFTTTVTYNSGSGKWELTTGTNVSPFGASFKFEFRCNTMVNFFAYYFEEVGNPSNNQSGGPVTTQCSPLDVHFGPTWRPAPGFCAVSGDVRVFE